MLDLAWLHFTTLKCVYGVNSTWVYSSFGDLFNSLQCCFVLHNLSFGYPAYLMLIIIYLVMWISEDWWNPNISRSESNHFCYLQLPLHSQCHFILAFEQSFQNGIVSGKMPNGGMEANLTSWCSFSKLLAGPTWRPGSGSWFFCSFNLSTLSCWVRSSRLFRSVETISVTRKKSPNVYKSCLKMISLEKW